MKGKNEEQKEQKRSLTRVLFLKRNNESKETKKMRKSISEQGMTLIALINTIIIILILVGVILVAVLWRNGLMQNESSSAEISKLKIGDVVYYTPKTGKTRYELKEELRGYSFASNAVKGDQTINQETYTWKIMNIDSTNNIVEIMGAPELSMKPVGFGGVTGYNNGVYFLNNICKEVYSNTDLGVEARSINIEDIEKHMNEDGINMRDAYTSIGGNIQYGSTTEYRGSHVDYPRLAEYEKHVGINSETVPADGIGRSDDGSSLDAGKITIPIINPDWPSTTRLIKQANEKITVQQTFYGGTQEKNYYKEPEFYNLLFKTSTYYWIASRYINCHREFADFGLVVVASDEIINSGEIGALDGYHQQCPHVVPVVSLGSDIRFTRNGIRRLEHR